MICHFVLINIAEATLFSVLEHYGDHQSRTYIFEIYFGSLTIMNIYNIYILN